MIVYIILIFNFIFILFFFYYRGRHDGSEEGGLLLALLQWQPRTARQQHDAAGVGGDIFDDGGMVLSSGRVSELFRNPPEMIHRAVRRPAH